MERTHFWFYHGQNSKNKNFNDSLRHASRGLLGALLFERNFRIEALIFAATVLAGLLFQISPTEWLIVLLVSLFIFIFELFNSSLEAVADALHPDYNEHIQRAKDMSAGAVLLVSLAALVIGLNLFGPYIIRLVVG